MSTLNPLEQKARSSFIKGILVAAVIGAIIIGFLGMQIYQMNGKEKQRLAGQKSVKVLSRDITSGELITADMFKTLKLDADAVPNGATDASQTLDTYQLQDDNGNEIVTRDVEETDQTTGQKNTVTKKYIKFNQEGDDGQEVLSEVFQDVAGTYYYLTSDNQRIDIKMTETPLVSKIDLGANSVVTSSMFTAYNEATTDDLREEEYASLVLPTTLQTGNTIDVRLRLPDGRDYVVLSKKKVTIPTVGDSLSSSSIIVKVKENEILTMSAAIVEAYKIEGSKLYAIKYVEPGMQDAATSTYVPSSDVLKLIQDDPNIVQAAKNQLIYYYNNNYDKFRTGIQNALNAEDETTRDAQGKSGTQTEASTLATQRQQYLQSMGTAGGDEE